MSGAKSRDFTPQERAVLERLCDDVTNGVEEARAQLAVARYAGPSHEGEDNCFDIEVPGDVPLLPIEQGLATLGLLVVVDGEPTGTIDLWVEDGRLHSLEHSWYTDDIPPFPSADQLYDHAEYLAREWPEPPAAPSVVE